MNTYIVVRRRSSVLLDRILIALNIQLGFLPIVQCLPFIKCVYLCGPFVWDAHCTLLSECNVYVTVVMYKSIFCSEDLCGMSFLTLNQLQKILGCPPRKGYERWESVALICSPMHLWSCPSMRISTEHAQSLNMCACKTVRHLTVPF
jgi:hypothetical protein